MADITLIPMIGRNGAVVGQLLSSATLVVGQYLLAERVYGTVIDRRFLGVNLGLVVGMGAIIEAQTQTNLPLLWASLDIAVGCALVLQLWNEKATLVEVWSRDLWKAPSQQPLAAGGA